MIKPLSKIDNIDNFAPQTCYQNRRLWMNLSFKIVISGIKIWMFLLKSISSFLQISVWSMKWSITIPAVGEFASFVDECLLKVMINSSIKIAVVERKSWFSEIQMWISNWFSPFLQMCNDQIRFAYVDKIALLDCWTCTYCDWVCLSADWSLPDCWWIRFDFMVRWLF